MNEQAPVSQLAGRGLNIEMNLEQMGLFADDAYTMERSILVALFTATQQMRRRGSRPPGSKPDVRQLNLSLPLLAEWGITESIEPSTTADKDGKPTPCLSEADLPSEFGEPTMVLCAKISAGLFWTSLKILLKDRGNEEEKKSIIDWLFATDYPRRPHDVPMYRMPFTAQFACWVEEIDYDMLIEALHWLIENNAPRTEKLSAQNNMEVLHGTNDTAGALWSAQ